MIRSATPQTQRFVEARHPALQTAALWRRLLAAIIDSTATWGASWWLVFTLGAAVAISGNADRAIWSAVALLLAIPAVLWVPTYAGWWLHALTRAQTPGKMLLGVFVLDEDGNRAGFWHMLLREVPVKLTCGCIGPVLSALVLFPVYRSTRGTVPSGGTITLALGLSVAPFILAALWCTWDRDRRCLWDRIAGTYAATQPVGSVSKLPPQSRPTFRGGLRLFPGAIARGIRNASHIRGRSTRTDYWCWYIFAGVITSLAALTEAVLGGSIPLGHAALVLLAIPNLSMLARRLHDLGLSVGWAATLWAAGIVPPIHQYYVGLDRLPRAMERPMSFYDDPTAVGFLILSWVAWAVEIALCVRPSDAGGNRYGPPASAMTPDEAAPLA